MSKKAKILLILIAIVCFGVALYYPISEAVQKKQNEDSMDMLASLRDAGRQKVATVTAEPAPEEEPDLPESEDPVPEKDDASVTEAEAPVTNAAETEAPAVDVLASGNTATNAPGQQSASQPGTNDTNVPGAGSETPVIGTAAATNAPAAVVTASVAQGEPVGAVSQATDSTGARETAALKPNEPIQEPNASVEPTRPVQEPDAPVEPTEPTQRPEQNVPAQEAPGAAAEATPSPTPTAVPTPTPEPTPTPNRMINTGVKTWDELEKVTLDTSKILPQYQELYSMNNDMVGWLTMPGTKIDFPVMQHEDEEYYLTHDFFNKENANGLLILGTKCDPYTPSYNLVVSGHNRNNGTMFSNINEYYGDYRHWKAHKYIQFDSLMEERTYIVFAAFYSGVYEDGEEGFRYNADIQYSIDANQWLKQVERYKLYETDVDVRFGDEFLTLTTCNSSRRKNGRFVVVARRLREGESME